MHVLSIFFLLGLMILTNLLCFCLGSIQASRRLHNALLSNILRGPILFFDTTPRGRIVNRFGNDIYSLDTAISTTFMDWIGSFLETSAAIVVISRNTPIFMLVAVPVIIIYYLIQVCISLVTLVSPFILICTHKKQLVHFLSEKQ